MAALEYLIVLVVIAAAVAMITGPLRAAHRRSDAGDDLAALEAARDAKYQEIRDAELDLRTGKLSDDDYQAIDQTLRAEAIEILRRIDLAQDAADAGGAEGSAAGADPPLPSRP